VSARHPTRDLSLAAMFAALISIGAVIAIPMVGPVPLTLQVLFVMLAGLLLGARLAALAATGYLLIGLVAPVYAGGSSGVGALLGPAGGYLFGFVLGAWLVGALAERLAPQTVWGLAAVALAGLLPIYALGAAWLAWQVHASSVQVVVWTGVLQFVPGDLAKALMAGLAARALISLPLGLPVPVRPR